MFLLVFLLPGTHPLAKSEEQMIQSLVGEHFSADSVDFNEELQPIIKRHWAFLLVQPMMGT